MPAYSKPITMYRCYCGARATQEVFNAVNAPLGYYCTRHAKERVRDLNRQSSAHGNRTTK